MSLHPRFVDEVLAQAARYRVLEQMEDSARIGLNRQRLRSPLSHHALDFRLHRGKRHQPQPLQHRFSFLTLLRVTNQH